MGALEAPQWLLSGFVRSVQAAGGTAQPEEIRSTGESLLQRWSSPERRFHNLKHLLSVLSRVDELTEETHEPDLVRLAAWYHGAVFASDLAATQANRGGEDEVASAAIALDELLALGVPEARAQRVHDLVAHLARHTTSPSDPDGAVLCDADLASSFSTRASSAVTFCRAGSSHRSDSGDTNSDGRASSLRRMRWRARRKSGCGMCWYSARSSSR